jgi:hypothetical protein
MHAALTFLGEQHIYEQIFVTWPISSHSMISLDRVYQDPKHKMTVMIANAFQYKSIRGTQCTPSESAVVPLAWFDNLEITIKQFSG